MNILGSIALRDSVTDFGDSSLLSGAIDVVTRHIGGTWYVFVAGYYDSGIQVLRLEGDQLEAVFSMPDSAAIGLYNLRELRILEVGSQTLLIAAGIGEDALTSFAIETRNPNRLGHLTVLNTIFDDSRGGTAPEIDSPYGLDAVVTSQGSFVLVTALLHKSGEGFIL